MLRALLAVRADGARVLCRRGLAGEAPGGTGAGAGPSTQSMSVRYRPTKLEKYILVWTKKFKSLADVPQYVKTETIDRARSEARIKIANRLMLLTALASLGAIITGKAAAKRGESVQKYNQDWHKEYVEDYNKKQEEAAKK